MSKRHVAKLGNFQKKKISDRNETKPSTYIKRSFHNVSSYVLSDEEYQALSFGLDHHIPNFTNYNAAETEFELLYQNILSNISDIPENELRQLKSKV